MKYDHIVVLGNGQDWLDKSLHDLTDMEHCRLINSILPIENRFVRSVARLHFSNRMNGCFKLPFKRIWYRRICKNICTERDDSILLIVYDWNKLGCEKSFLQYVKKYFPHIKMVYVITNIITITSAWKNRFVDQLGKYYDLVYAFEKDDAEKYGFKHSQLVYSRNETHGSEVQKEVFFAGSAKDRLPMLLKFYERFKAFGFACNFHILGVKPEDIVPLTGIEYNKRISYQQVIDETAKATCIIEVPQKNSSEWTIKLCEAIFYDKFFITTNRNILDAPFYDERYMFYVNDPDDLDESIFAGKNEVEYREDARYYFSVARFLSMIENDLEGER